MLENPSPVVVAGCFYCYFIYLNTTTGQHNQASLLEGTQWHSGYTIVTPTLLLLQGTKVILVKLREASGSDIEDA